MNFKEDTIESNYIYKGKIINVRKDKVELYNGKTSYREIVEHNGGVAIVAITKQKEIILVKQYRKPFEEVIIEIPAGKLEKGEKPDYCAARELQEETGYIPRDLKLLTILYPSPGFSNEKLYIFYCSEMDIGHTNFDEGENIELITKPFDEAVNMVYRGEIKDAKTVAGILFAKFLI